MPMVSKILCCKGRRENKYKDCACFNENPYYNSKNCFGSRIIFFLQAFLFVIRRFSPVSTPHWMQEKSTLMFKNAPGLVLCGFRYDISKLKTSSCKQFYN
jgi:hypothetical protein